MLTFFMNNVVFLPHSLLDKKTIAGGGDLAHVCDYANYINLLWIVYTLN